MFPFSEMMNLWYAPNVIKDAVEYWVDWQQRAVLFTDVMRKRGNNYLEHIQQDQPPVLVFPYTTIMDGRQFDKPVNYALVQIIDRRKKEPKPETSNRSNKLQSEGSKGSRAAAKSLTIETGGRATTERRVTSGVKKPKTTERPIVVIDPRAGHGPGIGGSKLNSQIGVAIDFGHPVYFILFFTEPEPGQTIYDVQQAEVKFLEEVNRRHPDADKPAVIGNCQAGWAAALIGADRPDIVGPMVFNGSPLSYWGGVDGANPMRYRGGLCGGVWLTSLWCDLANGKFDGAHLVANFEGLNPANTLWTKQYNLWRSIDTEESRYLNFEKWWGGFFKMNREEIHFIVDSLFVGNELESGFLQLQQGQTIQLKNFQDPIVVFASKGDNITPPQQALNWIYKVYGTVDEIKRHGQVIVYLLHEGIGHLGIFVSGSVAAKEHKQIMTSVRMIDYLAPGLYEMIIHENPSKPWLNDHQVEFVERDMDDIMSLDDGLEDEIAFQPVAAISRFNDKLYNTFVSPMVRFFSNEFTAQCLYQLHPLRTQRYLLSDINPCLLTVGVMADQVKQYRLPVQEDNIFLTLESLLSESIVGFLNIYRDIRDIYQEHLFKLIYGNTWMITLFGETYRQTAKECIQPVLSDTLVEQGLWRQAMSQGGFPEGVVRIIILIIGSNKIWARGQFGLAGKIIDVNERLNNIEASVLKRIIKQQAMFIHHDKEMSMDTLVNLLTTTEDRIEAFEIANTMATADMIVDEFEADSLEKIKTILEI